MFVGFSPEKAQIFIHKVNPFHSRFKGHLEEVNLHKLSCNKCPGTIRNYQFVGFKKRGRNHETLGTLNKIFINNITYMTS